MGYYLAGLSQGEEEDGLKIELVVAFREASEKQSCKEMTAAVASFLFGEVSAMIKEGACSGG